MAFDPVEIAHLIRLGVPGADVTLSDLRGDGLQYAAFVTSPAFAGISRLDRHRMIYKALAGRAEEDLQALAIQAAAPGE